MDEATSGLMRDRFLYCFTSPPQRLSTPSSGSTGLRSPCGIGRRRWRRDRGKADPTGARPARCTGFRFGATAYTPDVSAIPDESVAALEGLDLWIIDALRITPHPTHFSLSDALGWIERLKPRRAVLTNLHTDLDYATLRDTLPPNVIPAYDGMKLDAV